MRFVPGFCCALAAVAQLSAQLPAADHAAKRQKVLDALTTDGIIFVEGSATPPREDQTFIQSQDFQALTGLMTPGSALVMWRKGGITGQRIIVPPKAAYSWTGEQFGPVEASAMLGIPGLSTGALSALLDSLGAKHTRVYLLAQNTGWIGLSRTLSSLLGDSAVIGAGGRGGRGAVPIGGNARGAAPPAGRGVSPMDSSAAAAMRAATAAAMGDYAAIRLAMTQARAKKTDAEIALIKRAAEMSVEGHKAAMRMLYPGVAEYEIRGVFEGTIFRLGAERIGYPSIVGTGANATYLHYSADTMKSKAGDVVVMDAAADLHGYSADVTRSFPVSGKFSPEQKLIYESVLAAQTAAAATVKPGSTSAQMNAAANAELWKGLTKAGLVDSVGATFDNNGRPATQLSLFYFHGLSHGLGLDVHDPTYTENGGFVRNTIFTIEPGLYVRPATLDMIPNTPANAAYHAKLAKVLPKYLGIGVRIEDDWVVTDTGVLCLSCAAPHSVAEVEAIAGKNPIRP